MGFFGRTLSRLDEVKRVLSREPGARQFLAQADELRRNGQVAEAIEVLEKGLEQSPGSVAGHVALGRLLQQSGRLDPALLSYQAALKLDPQNLVALRQTADLYLSRGEKVDAIKKLKLFRALSPGDREVNELIRQLDEELAASHSAVRPEARPHPSAPTPARPDFPGVAMPPVPPLPAPAPAMPPQPAIEPVPWAAAVESSPVPSDVPHGSTERSAPEPVVPDVFGMPEGPEPHTSPVVADVMPSAGRWAEEPPPAAEVEPGAVVAAAEPAARLSPPATPAPSVTETLAELLRSQGHLGEARDAYLTLARAEADEGRARRLTAIAEEIASARQLSPRGRLDAWAEPFSRLCRRGEVDLAAAVEEVVRRLGPAAAVVTDLEGVPVVSAGPRAETEAMENLAAELTAFWKNVRRSRSEIGEGALDSLVLSGAAGTAAVKAITASYALLLKTGPGVPAGRIRFEAARAADQLRPALF